MAPARVTGRLESLGHDLLLLMLNLSRMQDRDRILRLFVEALGAAAPGVAVRVLGPSDATGADAVEVATPEARFARLVVEDPAGTLTDRDRATLRNAARMLAVVLENVTRAALLATENARLDGAVAARTAELQRALETTEDLYQNAACGYHSLDPDGVYVRVNDTELRWLGWPRADLVGKIRFHDLVAPDHRERFEQAFGALKQRGEMHDVELELVRRDGSPLPVLLSATAVLDGGRFVKSRATMYDLSERRRAEQALREAEDRLRHSQKLEALGRLAGGVAHDFNNLLTVILSCSDVLLEALPPGDPLREEAGEIRQAGAKAAGLTRQLLAFSRRHASRPVAIDVGGIVEGMEAMLRRLIGEDVELQVVRDARLAPVRADPGQLEQVVLNLVVNARDAMPGGGRVRLETSSVVLAGGDPAAPDLAPGPYVRLTVSDSGCGMSADVRAHLFEPFFTTKAEGHGTGLGLATVYGIVKQAGGDVRVDSEPGRGARFDVLLPALATAASPQPEPPAAETVGTGGESVLLVEDEPRVRAVAADALRRAGYTVREASDGEMALAMAQVAPRPDVLVTDLVMPRIGGVPLAARLRTELPRLAVVFVSGYAGAGSGVEQPLDLGPVLHKPFTAVALTRAVREQVERVARGTALTPGSTG